MFPKAISTLLICVVFLTVPNRGAEPPEVLTNNSVIKLKELGLGEALIIQKIKSTPANFDTSLAALEELTKAKVPEGVIAAMLGATKPAAESTLPAPVHSNDPLQPHESGVYSYEIQDSKPILTKLEPAVYTIETGALAKAAWGGTADRTAVPQGLTSRREFKERRPVFYFYFDKTSTGLNDTQTAATSPDAFTLAALEVLPKHNLRRLVIGTIRLYGNSTTGVPARFVKEFDFEKQGPGIFKVTPKADLPNGEYAFYYGGVQSQPLALTGSAGPIGKLFDFRINGPAETEPAAPVPEKKKSTPRKA